MSVSLSLISDVVQWNVVLSLQMDLAESTKIYLPLDTHSLTHTGMTMGWSSVNPSVLQRSKKQEKHRAGLLNVCMIVGEIRVGFCVPKS